MSNFSPNTKKTLWGAFICALVLLAIGVYSGYFSAKADTPQWSSAKEKLNDAGDAVSTKTKDAYYSAKDAVTPDASNKAASAANDAKNVAQSKLKEANA